MAEALRSGRPIRKITIANGVRPSPVLAEIQALARSRGLEVERAEKRAIERLVGSIHHQGVAAEADPYRYASVEEILASAQRRGEPALVLVLDSLQDPQNLGSLLRTGEAVGVHGVILPKHRAVGITPAVAKASAGATEHLTVAQVVNLPRALEELKEKGIWVIGLDAGATQSYEQVDPSLPLAIVVGSEGKGLGRLVKERCDLLVALPMRGRVASLNAAVAGSIVLYHLWRQRTRNGADQELLTRPSR